MDKSFETPCKYIANYKIKNTGLTPKKVFNMLKIDKLSLGDILTIQNSLLNSDDSNYESPLTPLLEKYKNRPDTSIEVTNAIKTDTAFLGKILDESVHVYHLMTDSSWKLNFTKETLPENIRFTINSENVNYFGTSYYKTLSTKDVYKLEYKDYQGGGEIASFVGISIQLPFIQGMNNHIAGFVYDYDFDEKFRKNFNNQLKLDGYLKGPLFSENTFNIADLNNLFVGNNLTFSNYSVISTSGPKRDHLTITNLYNPVQLRSTKIYIPAYLLEDEVNYGDGIPSFENNDDLSENELKERRLLYLIHNQFEINSSINKTTSINLENYPLHLAFNNEQLIVPFKKD